MQSYQQLLKKYNIKSAEQVIDQICEYAKKQDNENLKEYLKNFCITVDFIIAVETEKKQIRVETAAERLAREGHTKALYFLLDNFGANIDFAVRGAASSSDGEDVIRNLLSRGARPWPSLPTQGVCQQEKNQDKAKKQKYSINDFKINGLNAPFSNKLKMEYIYSDRWPIDMPEMFGIMKRFNQMLEAKELPFMHNKFNPDYISLRDIVYPLAFLGKFNLLKQVINKIQQVSIDSETKRVCNGELMVIAILGIKFEDRTVRFLATIEDSNFRQQLMSQASNIFPHYIRARPNFNLYLDKLEKKAEALYVTCKLQPTLSINEACIFFMRRLKILRAYTVLQKEMPQVLLLIIIRYLDPFINEIDDKTCLAVRKADVQLEINFHGLKTQGFFNKVSNKIKTKIPIAEVFVKDCFLFGKKCITATDHNDLDKMILEEQQRNPKNKEYCDLLKKHHLGF